MLTASEKRWLELRDASKHACGNCFIEQLRANKDYCEHVQLLEDYDQFVRFNPNRYGYCSNCEKNTGKDRSKGRLLDKWVSPEWYKLVEDEELEGIFSVEETETGKSRREYHATLRPDYQDALEFSERVAAKLARMMLWHNEEAYPCRHGKPDGMICMREQTKLSGPFAVHCEDCILKIAQLQVEEEMDNEERN